MILMYIQININVVVYPYLCIHVFIYTKPYSIPLGISYAMDETFFALWWFLLKKNKSSQYGVANNNNFAQILLCLFGTGFFLCFRHFSKI